MTPPIHSRVPGRARLWRAGCLLLVALAALQAQAMDVLVLRNGDKVTGRVHAEDGGEILINTFHSSYPDASNGFERIPVAQVVKRLHVLEPHQELAEKLAALVEGDVAGLLEVATWAKKARLPKAQVEELAVQVLASAPDRSLVKKDVKRLVGGSRLKKLLSSDPRLSPQLVELRSEYLTTADHQARKRLHDRAAKEHQAPDRPYYERAYRTQRFPRGYHEDLPLTYRSAEIKGVYTLWVPLDYDPWQSYPLLIGLHGGGVGGAAADEVVGDGPSAMQKYRSDGERRGYIVACPTAVQAGWGGQNSLLIDALLDEMRLRYNIDDNRIFLVGHSMGGGGSWAQGPRLSERLAGLGPLAAFRSQGFSQLVDHHTAVYCYHGANDNVCPVSAGRNAAKQLKRATEGWRDENFIYTEVPDSGHGYPSEVAAEMFDFFAGKVRWEGKGKKARRTVGARSSFLDRVTPLEVEYFGRFEEMTGEVGGELAGKKTADLLQILLKGGGMGAEVAPELGRRAGGDGKLMANLARAATDPRKEDSFNADVRALAAVALGHSGSADARAPLERALGDEVDDVRSAAGRALGRIGDPAASPAIAAAILRQGELLAGKERGSKLDYTDLEVSLRAHAALLEGLRGVHASEMAGSDAAAKAVADAVIGGAILSTLEVRYSERVGQDPVRLRRAFVREEVLPTLEKLELSEVQEALGNLKSHYAGRNEITNPLDELLAR